MLTFFKCCFVVISLLGLTLVQSQTQEAADIGSYFGLGADVFLASGVGIPIPAPSFQYGALVAPQFEVRGSLTTLIFINVISVDALYTRALPDTAWRYYVGGGPDLALFTSLFSDLGYPSLFFAAHATAGVEYRASKLIGLYAEGQPFLVFGTGITPGARLRTGVNFHF